MKKRKKVKHPYDVNIDMKYSTSYSVTATSAGAARKKAWARLKKTCPKKLFELLADRED